MSQIDKRDDHFGFWLAVAVATMKWAWHEYREFSAAHSYDWENKAW